MPKEKVVVFMGSPRDYEFASRVKNFLSEENFPVDCEYNVASAHKTPQKLIEDVRRYEESGDRIVYVTVAGLSDALSGVVAGVARRPVIACPPDLEKYGWAKAFSSSITPRGVAVALVPRPENAALMAVSILALSNEALSKALAEYKLKLVKNVYEASEQIKTKAEES